MFFCVYLVLLTLALVTFFVKRRYTYWQRNGFPYDKDTKIPFGCLESVSKHEKSMGMAIHDVYLKTNERYYGIYLLFRPAVLVRDVTLVRHVLAQDFGSFHDRGIYVDEKKDPLSANLFSLRGQSWRTMRTKLAPSFTSGKLKAMFGTVDDIGNKMVQHINTKLPTEGSAEVDLKEICTTYAVDIIGSVIFGLDIDSFKNPTNKFRQIVTRTRRNTFFSAVFGMLIFLVPDVAKFFFKLGFKNQVVLSILSIIKDTVAQREKENIVRKDLLQLLIQLRNSGEINEDDANWEFKTSAETKKSLSFEEMAANAFIFYIAGQETTASTASFTIFELAQYPELLQKAQEEVQTVLRENNNEYSYDSLKKMEFLEQCIKETIRKYPGLPILNRECTQDYRIPGTEHVIKKGTPIVIPLFGIHRDAAYFPNPDVYDPYRFSAENRDKFNQNAYMPFGEGPRHCIAQRMGVLNSKLAVAKILQNFNIEIMPRREIEIDNHAIALIPKGGVKVRLSKCKE